MDYADDQVARAVRAKRKGALAAYRDATLFKVVYGWGLRRTETAKLDLLDWGRNPAAPEFDRFGMLHVRYGKAKPAEINARFGIYRQALGLPRSLTLHSLRHSHVTHLTEDGV